MESTILILNYFSNLMKVVEGDMTRNYSRKDLDVSIYLDVKKNVFF